MQTAPERIIKLLLKNKALTKFAIGITAIGKNKTARQELLDRFRTSNIAVTRLVAIRTCLP